MTNLVYTGNAMIVIPLEYNMSIIHLINTLKRKTAWTSQKVFKNSIELKLISKKTYITLS